MKQVFKDAALGLFFAGMGALIIRFFGFTEISLIAILYLMVALAVVQGLKHRDFSSVMPSFLERIVVVVEGEELKMKKLLTGEKYRVKGDLEKL